MRLSFIIFFIILPAFSFSQKTDNRLQRKLEETVKGFNGNIGIYVKNMRTGKITVINADTVFPTASIVKVPILVGIMEKLNTGELNYDSVLVYKYSLLYEGEDILGSFKNNEKIYHNEVFSPKACDRMMRCLGRNYWDVNEAISMIPPYIEVFSKNGCLNAVRNEVLLVNASHNPYIFSFFTKNNKDQQWTQTNEAWTLARKISKLLWNYFEPKDKWEPFIK